MKGLIMADWSGEVGEWVTWIPDFKGNKDAQPEDQVTMEIRVLNHKQKSRYASMLRRLDQASLKDILDIKHQKVKENVRNIKNLEHQGRALECGKDLLDTQSQATIDFVCAKIDDKDDLTEDEIKN